MFVGRVLILCSGIAWANLFQIIKLPHTAESLNKELEGRILEALESAADSKDEIFDETCQLILELPELRSYKKLYRFCQKTVDGKLNIHINPKEILDRPILHRRAIALTRCFQTEDSRLTNHYLREEATLLTKYFNSMKKDVCPTLMQVNDKGSLKRFAKRVLIGGSQGLEEDWNYYRDHVDDDFHTFCVHMADLRYEQDSRIRDAAHRAISLIRTEREIWREAESSSPLDHPVRIRKASNAQHVLTPLSEREHQHVPEEFTEEEHQPAPSSEPEADDQLGPELDPEMEHQPAPIPRPENDDHHGPSPDREHAPAQIDDKQRSLESLGEADERNTVPESMTEGDDEPAVSSSSPHHLLEGDDEETPLSEPVTHDHRDNSLFEDDHTPLSPPSQDDFSERADDSTTQPLSTHESGAPGESESSGHDEFGTESVQSPHQPSQPSADEPEVVESSVSAEESDEHLENGDGDFEELDAAFQKDLENEGRVNTGQALRQSG